MKPALKILSFFYYHSNEQDLYIHLGHFLLYYKFLVSNLPDYSSSGYCIRCTPTAAADLMFHSFFIAVFRLF